MNRIALLTLSLAVPALTACAERTEKAPGILLNEASVNSDGSCTQDFIAGYSVIYEAHAQVRMAYNLPELKNPSEELKAKANDIKAKKDEVVMTAAKKMVNACTDFLKKHPNISCAAYVHGYREMQMINSDVIEDSCNEVKAKNKL